jgi:thioesterase domain-containing protein
MKGIGLSEGSYRNPGISGAWSSGNEWSSGIEVSAMAHEARDGIFIGESPMLADLKQVSELLADLAAKDIKVWVEGDRLRCNAPAGALTAELRDQLRDRKGEIIAFVNMATAAARQQPAEEIFQFHARGDRPPLYFFNGDLIGGHLSVRRMAELFGPDYPIISIDSHGLRGEPIPPSIEQMAADRLPLILERQASGPFLLGGKCNGAMVAFEAARQLIAAGHKVDMVAMVDPPTVNARPVTRAIIRLMKPVVSPYRLGRTYQLLTHLEVFFFRASTSEKITRLLKRLRKLHDGLSNPEVPPALWNAYLIVMAQYLPAPLEVPVSFYAADSDGRAWRLSSQLEVIEMPGRHNDTLASSAELLVDHLRQGIDLLTHASINEPHAPADAC